MYNSWLTLPYPHSTVRLDSPIPSFHSMLPAGSLAREHSDKLPDGDDNTLLKSCKIWGQEEAFMRVSLSVWLGSSVVTTDGWSWLLARVPAEVVVPWELAWHTTASKTTRSSDLILCPRVSCRMIRIQEGMLADLSDGPLSPYTDCVGLLTAGMALCCWLLAGCRQAHCRLLL